MAVENKKSTLVTNADATPKAATTSYINDGQLKEQIGTLEVDAANDDGSVFRMCRIPSNARISELALKNDAIVGGTDYDIGVYDIADVNSGAVVDADILAATLDLSAANDQFAEVETVAEEDVEQRLWELLGLSEDPAKVYDIALTGNTVGTAAGTLALRLRYTQ